MTYPWLPSSNILTEPIHSLASWLNISNKEMKDIKTLAGETSKHYKQYRIKSGRRITAPLGALKDVQKLIAKALGGYYSPHYVAHAYCKKRDVYTALEPHVSSKKILHLDIHNFFGSLKRQKFESQMSDRGYMYIAQCKPKAITMLSREQISLIADLCFFKGSLPVGSPASPQISNLMMIAFDKAVQKFVSGFAGKSGSAYTRYADDIVISGSKNIDNYIGTIYNIICAHDMEPNIKKTRVLRSGRRQQVFSLILNRVDKIKIHGDYIRFGILEDGTTPRPSREYRRNLRASIHQHNLAAEQAPKGEDLLNYREDLDPQVLKGKKAWVNTLANKKNQQ